MISLGYGSLFFVVSWMIASTLIVLEVTWMILPLTAEFLMVGPIWAVGLYEISRHLSHGEAVNLASALFVKTRAPTQIAFTGVLLMVLMLMWMRAATIIYALFFGLHAYPGILESILLLFSSVDGWLMMVVGGLVGGAFAVLAFAISIFSIPMMVVKDVDAITAMVRSVQAVRANPRVMFVWGAIITILSGAGLITGFAGMIVIYPLLGHASWHAYAAMFPDR